MPTPSTELSPAALEFVSERHLATLTTVRANGTPHVTAVGFTWDPEAGLVRVITDGGSAKVRNVRRGGYAAVSQVEGRRWLTLEGRAGGDGAAPDRQPAHKHEDRRPPPQPAQPPPPHLAPTR
uniref:pyridoxamine 5'-phosphate oxidase family protein n=1 Tax=Nocardia brasiliensis TaxID=37326 RepID=UPI002458D504